MATGSASPRWHKWRRAWPHIRAILIFFHVAAMLTFCLPGPGRVLRKESWKAPPSQRQFKNWSARVNSIGFNTTPKSFEAWLWDVSESYAGVHRKVSRPFWRYMRRFHLYQGWALFSSPQLTPVEIHIDIHDPATGYRPIYVQRSDTHSWHRDLFDSNRMRKLVGRIGRRKTLGRYPDLVKWVARTAAREFPSADKVRIRLLRYSALPPGSDRLRDNERFTDLRILKLESYR